MCMKILTLCLFFNLLLCSHLYASEWLERTSACRMEVKILGPDVLDEDKDCLWLEEHKSQVVAACKKCIVELERIKEASRGNFDY